MKTAYPAAYPAIDPQIPKTGRQREGCWGPELVRDKKIMGFPAGADNRETAQHFSAGSIKGKNGLAT